MSCTYNSNKETSSLAITNNNCSASYKGSTNGWEISVCEICPEVKFFKVRIENNPQRRDLCIGVTLSTEEVQLDVLSAYRNSWMIDIGNQQLYERGLYGPSGRHLVELSSVIIEKNVAQCAILFYVNDEKIKDKNSKPDG